MLIHLIMNLLISSMLLSLLYTTQLIALNFNTDVSVTYGGWHVDISSDGAEMNLQMDQSSGSGAATNDEFLFGKFDMRLKLNPPDSLGTITTFYLQSPNRELGWDEADFELLGATDTSYYKIHTNIITSGTGDREQQFLFPFDPTTDFHLYSFFWTPQQIIWSLDSIPIRVFRKLNDSNISFPDQQPMKVYTTLWNSSSWTGEVNWTNAPFSAQYKNFHVNACIAWRDGSEVKSNCSREPPYWLKHNLSSWERDRIIGMREYIIYDYCNATQIVTNATRIECANNP